MLCVHHRRAMLLLGLAPLFPVAGAAGEAQLSVVEVQAERLQEVPAPSGALGGAVLQAGRAARSDTAALLGDLPGVNLQGAGAISSLPVVNGLAGDRVRTKVDGMDLIASCPNHMNPPLSYLAPSAVETLKVYAGIAPVSAGGDSIAGSIEAQSAPPRFAAAGAGPLFAGEIGAYWRSNGKARGANLGVTLANENLSLSYAGSAAQADNYKAGGSFKDYTATGVAGHSLRRSEVGSSGFEARNHDLGVALKNANHLFTAKASVQRQPYQDFPNQRMDIVQNDAQRFNLRYQGSYDWGKFDARFYREQVEHAMDFGRDKRFWYGTLSGGAIGRPCAPLRFAGDPAGTCAAGMPMHSDSRTLGMVLKADLAIADDALLRLGSEWQDYRLDDWWPASGGGMGPNTFWNINDGRRRRAALFGEWEKSFSPAWQSVIGARYERVSSSAGPVSGYSSAMMAMGNQLADSAAFNAAARKRRDHNFDFSAVARHRMSARSDVEFGLARKVRSPNLYERYTWSTWSMAAAMNNFVGDGNAYLGRTDLKPEKAHTLAATFDLHSPDRRYELLLTPFFTYVVDYIDAVRCTSGACAPANASVRNQFVTLQYANQNARLYGIDVSGKLPLGSNAYGAWRLAGKLNYTNGKNRETGDHLYNVMPLNARLSLTQQQNAWENSAELLLVRAKTQRSAVRNEMPTSGYALLNLRSSYTWKRLRLDFGIDNLFDRRYDLPLGGAYLGQGRTMSLNPPASDGMIAWGTPMPGPGRSLYAGASYRF